MLKNGIQEFLLHKNLIDLLPLKTDFLNNYILEQNLIKFSNFRIYIHYPSLRWRKRTHMSLSI